MPALPFLRRFPRRRASVAAGAAVIAVVGTLAGVVATSPTAQAATGCQVAYQLNQWTGGFTANITLTPGDTALSSWKVTWTNAAGQVITSGWNATVTQSGTAVAAVNMSYNGSVPAGTSTSFGVQGTWTSTDPVPTDFALNGTACNGGAGTSPSPSVSPSTSQSASVSPTASDVPTSPSASRTASPSPTVSTSPTGSSGCGTATFCDGFESGDNWTVSNKDCSGTGTAALDSTVAHTGTDSLKITGTAGYCNHVFALAPTTFSAIGPVWYARFYVNHTTLLPASHIAFAAMKDANDSGDDLRFGGQNSALQWNRQSDDATLPDQSPTGVSLSASLPINTWSCLEFMVNGSTGTMDTWLNGTQLTGLHEDMTATSDIDDQWINSRPSWRPALTDFRLGWEAYGDGADTLWYDDVALSSSRIGC